MLYDTQFTETKLLLMALGEESTEDIIKMIDDNLPPSAIDALLNAMDQVFEACMKVEELRRNRTQYIE